MGVEMRLLLCFVIALVSVIPALVSFFEAKNSGDVLKKIFVTCGVVFLPTHMIFASFSLLARTNEGFTIMSLTWFSIVIFVLCEISIYSSTLFYFIKKKIGAFYEREICIAMAIINGFFGITYPLYHYLINTIDFLTMIVFLLPFIAHTTTLSLNAIKYEKPNKLNKKIKK